MKLSARILRLLPPLLLGLSGLTALLQTLAYLLNYEAPDANYFETSAVFPALATGLCVATVLAGSLAALLIPKGECPEPAVWLGTRPHRVACAAAAVGFFAGAAAGLFSSEAISCFGAAAVFSVRRRAAFTQKVPPQRTGPNAA